MTDARNDGKLTKFVFDSYWKEGQQFIGITSNYDND